MGLTTFYSRERILPFSLQCPCQTSLMVKLPDEFSASFGSKMESQPASFLCSLEDGSGSLLEAVRTGRPGGDYREQTFTLPILTLFTSSNALKLANVLVLTAKYAPEPCQTTTVLTQVHLSTLKVTALIRNSKLSHYHIRLFQRVP